MQTVGDSLRWIHPKLSSLSSHFCGFDPFFHICNSLCKLTSLHRNKGAAEKQRWCAMCSKIVFNGTQTIANYLRRHYHILVSSHLGCKSLQFLRKYCVLFAVIGDSDGINVKCVSSYANCLLSSYRKLFNLRLFLALSRAYQNCKLNVFAYFRGFGYLYENSNS